MLAATTTGTCRGGLRQRFVVFGAEPGGADDQRGACSSAIAARFQDRGGDREVDDDVGGGEQQRRILAAANARRLRHQPARRRRRPAPDGRAAPYRLPARLAPVVSSTVCISIRPIRPAQPATPIRMVPSLSCSS